MALKLAESRDTVDLRVKVETYLRTGLSPEAVRVLSEMLKLGHVYLVGGAIRDIALGRTPADLDVAVKTSMIRLYKRIEEPDMQALLAKVPEVGDFPKRKAVEDPEKIKRAELEALVPRKVHDRPKGKTGLRGHRLMVGGMQIDIWPLETTLGIAEKTYPASGMGLAEAMQLNVDAVAMRLEDIRGGVRVRQMYDAGFIEGMKSRIIEANNVQVSPLTMGLYRVLRLRWTLGFKLGESAVEYLNRFYPKTNMEKLRWVEAKAGKSPVCPDEVLTWSMM